MKYKGINLFKNFGNLSCSNYSSNGLSGCKSTKNLKDQQFEENVSSSSRNARLTRRQKMSLAFMEAFDELKVDKEASSKLNLKRYTEDINKAMLK